MPDASFVRLSDQFDDWQADLLAGQRPVTYAVTDDETSPLARLQLYPGRICLIGGAPTAGKTAFVMQLILDACRLTPTLSCLVMNIEMPPTVLLDRQLARLSGVPLTTITNRQFTDHVRERVHIGLAALKGIAQQLTFCLYPYNLANVAASADAVNADVIVLDYIQRIEPAEEPGLSADRRGQIDSVMKTARRIADTGRAVILVAALSRQKNSAGSSTYDTASLASFRESSELEYGADDAWILQPTGPGQVTARHVKARHSEQRDIVFDFDGRLQRFTPSVDNDSASVFSDDELAELWGTDDAEDAS